MYYNKLNFRIWMPAVDAVSCGCSGWRPLNMCLERSAHKAFIVYIFDSGVSDQYGVSANVMLSRPFPALGLAQFADRSSLPDDRPWAAAGWLDCCLPLAEVADGTLLRGEGVAGSPCVDIGPSGGRGGGEGICRSPRAPYGWAVCGTEGTGGGGIWVSVGWGSQRTGWWWGLATGGGAFVGVTSGLRDVVSALATPRPWPCVSGVCGTAPGDRQLGAAANARCILHISWFWCCNYVVRFNTDWLNLSFWDIATVRSATDFSTDFYSFLTISNIFTGSFLISFLTSAISARIPFRLSVTESHIWI